MSTVDSLLVVASSAVTRDFYQQILNPKANPDFLIKLSKQITLTLAIISLIVALAYHLFHLQGQYFGLLFLVGQE